MESVWLLDLHGRYGENVNVCVCVCEREGGGEREKEREGGEEIGGGRIEGEILDYFLYSGLYYFGLGLDQALFQNNQSTSQAFVGFS